MCECSQLNWAGVDQTAAHHPLPETDGVVIEKSEADTALANSLRKIADDIERGRFFEANLSMQSFYNDTTPPQATSRQFAPSGHWVYVLTCSEQVLGK